MRAIRAPMLRAAGFAMGVAAVAIHNEVVFGFNAPRELVLLSLLAGGYALGSWIALSAEPSRAAQRFRRARALHFTDIVLATVLVYASGGARSWLFFFALIPVMNQMHVGPRQANVSGLFATLSFIAMLFYVRFVDGVPVDLPEAALKTLLMLMFTTYATLGALVAERSRRTVSERLQGERSEAESRAVYLSALNRVTQTVGGELDLDRMLQMVTEEMVGVFRASSSSITVLDDDRRVLVIKAFHSTNPAQRSAVGVKIPLENNPSSSYVVGTGRALIIADAKTSPLTEPMHELIEELGIHCMMLAPLVSHGEVIGTIGVDTNDPARVFSGDELALVQTIAGQIAGPVGNARLFVEEKRSRELAERLAATARAVGESLEPAIVLSQILEQLQRVIDYDSGSIQMIEGDAMRIIAVRGLDGGEIGRYRKLRDHPFNERLASSHEPVIVALPDEADVWNPVPELTDIRTVLGVPLIVRDRIIGALTIDSRRPHAYSRRDADAAMAFARQAAIAIDHAGLFASAREELAERRKAERELLDLKRQLEETNLRLLELSARDTLTGLANRRRFDEVFMAEWRRAIRTQSPLALMMIDIDQFKAFNDTYGHPRGDDVLRRVGGALGDSMKRAGDFTARYGGEEFVVLLPAADLASAAAFAESLRRRVESLAIRHEASPTGFVTISVGVAAAVPRDADEASALVAVADERLYRAKKLGRNRVEATEVAVDAGAPIRRATE